ncbi:Fic/DOC family protein [Vibrio ulleungensis]|uniref:protein adenylyltransferase n=1 Tax=Vibrio ulleungensis TaxID=2807619 RepID=A0ABS2HHS6_9VIBR|nr:Fic family protein [Vibrio ulleungensis]MBM7036559.1 Fic family protein [Vibrio ulleungensis]
MRDKYGAGHDKYCYPNTDILINKLNIHDSDLLAEAETAFTAQRYLEYSSNVTDLNQLDFHHFKSLHHHLFQDLFDWAGQVREVDISKGNTRFCNISRIEPEANKLFNSIPQLANQPQADLITALADLFCELNLLHPFREGNGRTLRFFFEELLFILGYNIQWPQISQQDWIDANISGVMLNLTPLTNIFEAAIFIDKPQ